ncbi:MAG: hypothetical protein OEX01_05740 [Candidatus Bathyarchaeota archaeon]|nr:hypothetical protein [Candidatus Bathyarchaeota archaeon]
MVRNLNSDVEDEDFKLIENIQKEKGFMSRRQAIHEICNVYREKMLGIETNSMSENREDKEEDTPYFSDFGAFACRFRKAKDDEDFTCYSRNPLVRVKSNGTIPKDICRLCEKEQQEKQLLNRVTSTKSGQAYKEYHAKLSEKHIENLEYKREIEKIKTEGMRERKQVKASTSRSYRKKMDMGKSKGRPHSYNDPNCTCNQCREKRKDLENMFPLG